MACLPNVQHGSVLTNHQAKMGCTIRVRERGATQKKSWCAPSTPISKEQDVALGTVEHDFILRGEVRANIKKHLHGRRRRGKEGEVIRIANGTSKRISKETSDVSQGETGQHFCNFANLHAILSGFNLTLTYIEECKYNFL